MKKHWKQSGSAILIRQMEEILDGPESQEVKWLTAAELAWSRGCDVDAPLTPATDRIAELRAAGDFRQLNRENMLRGVWLTAEHEARNVARFNAMRRWASEPDAAERQAEELQRAKEAADAAALETRAHEILATEHRAALERARAKARKELAHADR